ncbi:hypothetical protein CBR_g22338 [Chara braunii]|uniref:EF-hand domain-containing protein n=1 Tax=Chara braunii TaxID=69332 RepID=A0A388JUR3_CHABU|nr:hypothetical protein CBR_g22338 [Chara braunii]|eukprot:GBG61541.1 hypothetical protein CBR_g22338 [Chara braunii]
MMADALRLEVIGREGGGGVSGGACGSGMGGGDDDSLDMGPPTTSSGACAGMSDSSLTQYLASSKMKIDELFIQWLSLPESQKLVLSLLEDAQAGLPLVGPSGSTSSGGSSVGGSGHGGAGVGACSPLSPSSSQSLFAATTPPLSPRGSGGSPLSPKSPARRMGMPFVGPSISPMKKAADTRHFIPQFYWPEGPPAAKEAKSQCVSKANQLFAAGNNPNGLGMSAFGPVTRDVCRVPSFFNGCLFRKVDSDNTGLVSKDKFIQFWCEGTPNLMMADLPTRVFHVLKQADRNFLVQDDFRPLLRELLATHPGLEFLHETPEFQERYAETVIYRIFYHVNRSGNGRITLRELKRSNLISAMKHVDDEEDINKVLRYFSYEHFYVIYCKFWELDSDHDFLLGKDDLIRYGQHALTYRIVERIFSQVARKFTSGVEGKMNYEDFVWFILSEEDKTTERSLEYWFKCIDLDCDGKITAKEMHYFYREQLDRMECMTQEPVLFEDVVCQMSDMIKPEKDGEITLRDLKRCKLSGSFFNILFNLNKFVAFETRDPFLIRQEREDPTLTEWDRFARAEYVRLSMEDEGEDGSNGNGEDWDENLEAPF